MDLAKHRDKRRAEAFPPPNFRGVQSHEGIKSRLEMLILAVWFPPETRDLAIERTRGKFSTRYTYIYC